MLTTAFVANKTHSPFKSAQVGIATDPAVQTKEALENKKRIEELVKNGTVKQSITKEQLKELAEKHRDDFEDSKNFSAY